MTLWTAILLTAVVCYGVKLIGYQAPKHWLENEHVSRTTDLLTVALLAALVAYQTLQGPGTSIVLDARVPALLVAAGLLFMRAPFIVVVFAAAVVAAAIRGFTNWG